MQVLEENDSCLVDITSPKNSFSNCDSIKYSSALSICDSELLCRICRDNDNNQDLLSHCQCKGSIGFVHTSCLLTWIKKSGLDTCELCHEKYVTISRMNKRFWQWHLPRIGVKGSFKLLLFTGFLSMFVAFTTWILWSRISSSKAAKQERAKSEIKYSYIVYGVLVFVAMVGMYALNFRSFTSYFRKFIVINQEITVIPNGEICTEETANDSLRQQCELKLPRTKKYPRKHDLQVLNKTRVQVQVVHSTLYGSKLPSAEVKVV